MVGAAPERESWRRRSASAGHELYFFVGVAFLVLAAVSTLSVIVSDHVARRNGMDEAQRTTVRIANLLVGPFIEGYLAGEPGAEEALARIVGNRLRDDTLHSIIVWDARGRVLYSSDEELEGLVLEPTDELLAAARGQVVASVDDAPETALGRETADPVLEVYAPIPDVATPLVLEAYLDHSLIDTQAALVRSQILPVTLGGLVVLQVVQIPIAASLAARVRRHEAERAAIVERNLAESERERRTVAADLHDGPVQDLAGVGYALGALRSSVPADRQPTVDRLLDTVHAAVVSLRQVMIDVYPPDLSGEGLPQAVQMLTDRLRDQGMAVHLEVAPLPPMGSAQAAAIYRTAKEGLANAVHHAEASQVWVRLAPLDGSGLVRVRVEIADDGVGFPLDGSGLSPDGHLGLQLMRARLTELGGQLRLGARPGGGAMVTAEVPANRAE